MAASNNAEARRNHAKILNLGRELLDAFHLPQPWRLRGYDLCTTVIALQIGKAELAFDAEDPDTILKVVTSLCAAQRAFVGMAS